MSESIPVVFCVDAEPDEFTPAPDRPDPWLGYEATHRLSADWRKMFEDATGKPVALSWFVRSDPQVASIYGSPSWAFERYEESIAACLEAGDEIGLHVHLSRWCQELGRWLEDFSSSNWAGDCVRTGLAGYRAAFGARCRSIRLGNHWMNQETSDLLEEHRVAYDLTTEPGALPRDRMSERHVVLGALPDYTSMPVGPYRRSSHSFLEPDDQREEGLFVLPVSTARIDAGSPEAARDASDDGAYLRLGLWYPNAAFRYVFETALCDVDPTCLVIVMRSDMPLTLGWSANISENIDWLRAHPLCRRLVVSTPRDAVAAITSLQDRPTHVEPLPGQVARARSA